MLTYRELKAIQEGNRRNPDILTLLREIKEHRELLVDLYVFMGTLIVNTQKPGLSEEHYRLCTAMRELPCIVEYERMIETKRRIEYTRRAEEANRQWTKQNAHLEGNIESSNPRER